MKVMKMDFRDYVECVNYKVDLLFWFKYVEFKKYGNLYYVGVFLYRRYFIDDFLENFFLFNFVKIYVIVL